MTDFKKIRETDILELISWRKILIIYTKCLVFNIFVLIKWFLKSVRSRVDKKFRFNEKLRLYRKFQFLTSHKNDEKSQSSYDKTNTYKISKTPGFLINTVLGSHSFVKLKVSIVEEFLI